MPNLSATAGCCSFSQLCWSSCFYFCWNRKQQKAFFFLNRNGFFEWIGFCMGGELCLCVWGLLMTFFIVFSRTNLNEFTCVFVLFEKLQIHLRNKQCIIFCFHVLSIHCYLFCMSLWNESNQYAFRLLLLKDGYFSLLLLWVLCVLKRPFLHYFRQYTKYMSARVCVCVFNLRMLLASSHYYCFIVFFFLDYHEKK